MNNHIGSVSNLITSVLSVNLSESQIEIFWNRVSKSGPNDCWLWNGHKDRYGYGAFNANRKILRAHRTAWILTNGAIPNGLHVLHNCPNGDNPACCNPAHMWLGTHQQNMADCNSKGRRRAKLDGDKVRQIRKLKEAGETFVGIAKLYGVSDRTIRSVITREWWAHVP